MKRLLVVLLCFLTLMLGACSMDDISNSLQRGLFSNSSSSDEYAFEDTAEKLTEDTTFYNAYLGVSYTVPNGWWLYAVNADNFDKNASATTDASTLDIYFGEGYSYLELLEFANLQYSNKDNHIGIMIDAETVEGIDTLDAYMADYIEFMLEPYGGDPYTLAEESETELQGRPFKQCIFDVGQEDYPYKVITLTCKVDNEYFLTLSSSYWPENKTAVENILQYVDTGLKFL